MTMHKKSFSFNSTFDIRLLKKNHTNIALRYLKLFFFQLILWRILNTEQTDVTRINQTVLFLDHNLGSFIILLKIIPTKLYINWYHGYTYVNIIIIIYELSQNEIFAKIKWKESLSRKTKSYKNKFGKPHFQTASWVCLFWTTKFPRNCIEVTLIFLSISEEKRKTMCINIYKNNQSTNGINFPHCC